MSEETIKEAIKHRVNELRTRKNTPATLLKAPQSDIIPVQKRTSGPTVIQHPFTFNTVTNSTSIISNESSQVSVSNDSGR